MTTDPNEQVAESTGRGRLGHSLRLGLIYVGFFLFLGMFMPYWPVWLKDLGLGATEIGILVALTHAMKIVTSPVIGQISDRSGNRRLILIALSGLAVISFAFYFEARTLWALALVTLISHIFIPAILPLTEQVTMSAVRRQGLHYGRVRSSGSVAFIAATLFGGALLDRFEPGVILPFSIAALALTLVAVLLLPPDAPRRQRNSGRVGFAPIFGLLADRNLAVVMIAVALLQASHGVYYALGTVHWLGAGVGAGTVGLLWGVAVVAEVVLFIVAQRWIARQNPMAVFLWVAILGAARWTLVSLTTDPALLLVAQCLHAATYGATHLATIAFLARHVPEHRAATAQAIYSAGPMGLALGLVMAMSGALYDAVGGGAFLAMAGMCGVCAFVSCLALRPPSRL